MEGITQIDDVAFYRAWGVACRHGGLRPQAQALGYALLGLLDKAGWPDGIRASRQALGGLSGAILTRARGELLETGMWAQLAESGHAPVWYCNYEAMLAYQAQPIRLVYRRKRAKVATSPSGWPAQGNERSPGGMVN